MELCDDHKPLGLCEITAFHCTSESSMRNIIQHGFDERLSRKGYFGAGIYFSDSPVKANEFAFGYRNQNCRQHNSNACKFCERCLLICTVNMGRPYNTQRPWQEEHPILTMWGPNWGPKLGPNHYGQIRVQNWGPNHYGQIGVQNCGPNWGSNHYGQIGVQNWGPNWGPNQYGTSHNTWKHRFRGHPPESFNSVSGCDHQNQKVYAVYRGNQVYPKYAVRYKLKQKQPK